MSKSKKLLSKASLDLLKTAYPLYCAYCAAQDDGCSGKQEPCIGLASRCDSIKDNAFKLLADPKAIGKIGAFNKGKDQLGNKALKLIAREAIKGSNGDQSKGFDLFIAEIEARMDKAITA